MTERAADRVTVPGVVGLPFRIGRAVASAAGVSLANPDPDGPPIRALAWPGLFFITSQRPAPGTEVSRWDSVVVEISEHGTAESGARAPAPHPMLSDHDHAIPERERFVNLAPDELDAPAAGRGRHPGTRIDR